MNVDKVYLTEEEIMKLSLDDFRDLSSDGALNDNFRRLFQIMGLIYQNQVEIRKSLENGARALS